MIDIRGGILEDYFPSLHLLRGLLDTFIISLFLLLMQIVSTSFASRIFLREMNQNVVWSEFSFLTSPQQLFVTTIHLNNYTDICTFRHCFEIAHTSSKRLQLQCQQNCSGVKYAFLDTDLTDSSKETTTRNFKTL